MWSVQYLDRGDQLRKYHVCVKSRKSYKYIFRFVFEVCVLHSFILSRYSPSSHPTSSYLLFRKELAKELISNCNCRRRQVITQTVIHRHLVTPAKHHPDASANFQHVIGKQYGTAAHVTNIYALQEITLQTLS